MICSLSTISLRESLFVITISDVSTGMMCSQVNDFLKGNVFSSKISLRNEVFLNDDFLTGMRFS